MTTSDTPDLPLIQITHLSSEGWGRGNYLERPIEVPFTLPGDSIKVSIRKKSRRLIKGHLEEVVTPAPKRIEPRCIHFATCGGCKFQEMDYQSQLEWKTDVIKNLYAGMDVGIDPIVGSDPIWRWRNKMEFSFSSDLQGNRYLGLMKEGARGRVLSIDECHLCGTWCLDAIQAVRDWWEKENITAFHPHKNRGTLRSMILREGLKTGDRMVCLVVSGHPDDALHQGALKSFVQAIQSSVKPHDDTMALSIYLVIHQAIKGQPTQFYEMHLAGPDHIKEKLDIDYRGIKNTHQFHISPRSFFQPNTRQAGVLYQLGLEMIDPKADDVVWDLYCGMASFSTAISPYVKQVVGVELSKEALVDAEVNLAWNKTQNIVLKGADVGQLLEESNSELPMPDIVVVDPPRSGLSPMALQGLLRLSPRGILYISCNPATQARDVQEMIKHGWQLKRLRPVDQFPHTQHVECIAWLERVGNFQTLS